jgi:hypothetical protein
LKDLRPIPAQGNQDLLVADALYILDRVPAMEVTADGLIPANLYVIGVVEVQLQFHGCSGSRLFRHPVFLSSILNGTGGPA